MTILHVIKYLSAVPVTSESPDEYDVSKLIYSLPHSMQQALYKAIYEEEHSLFEILYKGNYTELKKFMLVYEGPL